MTRYWTLDEARAALKQVVPLLEELREIVSDRAGSGMSREAAAPLRTNGRAHDGQTALLTRARALLEAINDLGVQVKDVEAGLIDFPYLRDGEEVLLCFRLGEADIDYWHSLDGGFAGRRPIGEL